MDISVKYVQKMYVFGYIAIKCPKHTYVIAKAIRKVPMKIKRFRAGFYTSLV